MHNSKFSKQTDKWKPAVNLEKDSNEPKWMQFVFVEGFRIAEEDGANEEKCKIIMNEKVNLN